MGGIRLRVWLAAALFAIILLAALPPLGLGDMALDAAGREYAERNAAAAASVMALALDSLPADSRPRLIGDGRARLPARFTLFSRDGRALADTHEDASRMERHLNRPEVEAALAGRPGADARRSSTLGRDFVYAAVPLADGGAVRCALPLAEAGRGRKIWREGLPGACLFSLAAILVLGLWLARFLARPLELAAAAAESFAAGRLDARLPLAGAAEARRLSAALNRLGGESDSRLGALSRRNGEMAAALENMSEGLLAIDSGGRAIIFNPAARALLGVGETAAAGGNAAALIRQPELLELIRDAAASDAPLERDLRLSFEGSAGDRLAQAQAVPLREGAGGSRGTLLTLRDVTRLRELELVRRDFVANVSHELRTPVTSIQGSLEALRDGGLDNRADAGELLDMALRNARRLGSIIGNLLLLAGMEAGEPAGTGAAAPASVAEALAEAEAVCREAAEARGAEIRVECEAGLSALMNRRLIVHALANIIDNAVKYGPEGGVIAIRAFRDGGEARIRIADRGPGISPSHRERVFERFYRVDGARRLREGSGLGLAIVKHIAQSQGGSVALESGPGAGSVFTLSLPGA